MHQRVPVSLDRRRVDLRRTDVHELLRNCGTARQEQPALSECAQARAEVEPEQASERHAEVGIAVGVDGELGGLEAFLANDTLQRGAPLGAR
jgi:hypothetical protein